MNSENEDTGLFLFAELGLDETVLKAVEAKGFTAPTPIQVLAIPRLLNGDANVIAKARTGTGKTAAFALPLVQELSADSGAPRALVLVPTRELAIQVATEIDSFRTGGFPRTTVVYGGASIVAQLRSLKAGTEIVVGTPGRVIDHLERKSLDLSRIEYFILDEADEMLNMGFIEDIEAIFGKANPEARVLMFSATMPKEILAIASDFMGEYEIVEEETPEEEPILTEQFFCVVREDDKTEALVRIIDKSPDFYGLVFCQTKADAEAVAKELDERHYQAAALHGDIAQIQREKILDRFRKKKTRVLVATDVAARGIDIEGLSHVINYALPYDGPTYTHRIGRTGRAGARGIAITFVKPQEQRRLGYFRKQARGELKEMKIPSVSEVLAIKRRRLEDSLLLSLNAILPSTDQSSFTDESGADSVGTPFSSDPAFSPFVDFAGKIASGRNPMDVLAAVLSLQFGESLSPSQYSSVRSVSSSAADKAHVRLYVSLGRRDGMTKRGIAQFFRSLLKIPERLVDGIEVADSFSLATLPAESAKEALDISRRNRRVPHMHIDVKDSESAAADFSFSGKNGKRRKGAAGASNPPKSPKPAKIGDGRRPKAGEGTERPFDRTRRGSKTEAENSSRRKTRTYSRGPKPDAPRGSS